MRKHGIRRAYARTAYTFFGIFEESGRDGRGPAVLKQLSVVRTTSGEYRVTVLGTGMYLTPAQCRSLRVLRKHDVSARGSAQLDASVLTRGEINLIPVERMAADGKSEVSALRRNVLAKAVPLHLAIAHGAAGGEHQVLNFESRRLGLTIEDQIREAVRIVSEIYGISEAEAGSQMGVKPQG